MSFGGGRPVRKYMYLHAKKRALSRYGIELTPELNKQISLKIKNKKYIKRLFLSQMRDEVWYFHDGNICRLIWDKNKERVVTFLPDLKSLIDTYENG